MSAPDVIKNLVERFEANRESYRKQQYKETRLRIEFLDPFFEALGWDVSNKQGFAEMYKNVIHEDSFEIEGEKKAPDYAFRVGGQRKFFVEAKQPFVNIETNIDPAFQLRRYAWSAKLPLSILTDFEEFAVYDCRIKPDKKDKASVARIKLYSYKDYLEKWDEIAAIFSSDAVLKGSFDQYAESMKTKKGTTQVDDAFLEEIERWREMLAKNIALRNQSLNVRELNYAVQMTIDRIVFLRICEDRGVERDEQLKEIGNPPPLSLRDISPKFDNKDFSKKEKEAKSNLGEESQAEGRVYEALCQLFKKADARYNSGLFHFQDEKDASSPTDTLTLNLNIDDKPLKDILENLYYPESPYVFREIPADILGQVYERFLGKVIRLTPSRQAKVEEKPEVRKAGGVYYTPTYIVNYIVQNTVGKLLEGQGIGNRELGIGNRESGIGLTPDQVAKLKILDPACGSGTFPLGAYQYLLDWHLKWYIDHDPEKWATGKKPVIFQTKDGYRLTTSKKKEILLNNIYGVDIDPQAVEVTKLSLLLKVLEGESQETIGSQLSFLQERVLPDLGKNIQCGNSLIGSDYYEGHQLTMNFADDEERIKVNAFDWKSAFPQIMMHGGFDVVIGNPPYVLLQNELRDNNQLSYFRNKYKTASYKLDTYHLFIELGINLTRKNGRFSMITPANFLTNNYATELRRMFLEKTLVENIIVIDGGVFDGVSVDNAIFVLIAGNQTENNFKLTTANANNQLLEPTNTLMLSPQNILSNEFVLFTGESDGEIANIWKRCIDKSIKLGNLADVNFGKQLRDRKKFPNDVITITGNQKIVSPYKKCYTGRDVNRYRLDWNNLACFDDEEARRGGCWDAEAQNAKNKLICRQIGESPEFAIDLFGYQCLNTMFMVNLRDKQFNPLFILGILNSSLIKILWNDKFYDKRKTFPKIKGTYLKELPIYSINFSDNTEKSKHDKMVSLVERMLELHKQNPRTPQEQERVKREIESTDNAIDKLVYELYGLTEEEIKIVEGS